MDITLCSNDGCPHRDVCRRGLKSQDQWQAYSDFKLVDGQCAFFEPRVMDLEGMRKYCEVIPSPSVMELEVILEPRGVNIPRVCYGCGELSRTLAQLKTLHNYIEVCDVCLGKLDEVSFKARTIKPFSLNGNTKEDQGPQSQASAEEVL